MLRLLVQIFVCIFAAGLTLYTYVDRQNDITQLRLQIPVVEKEYRAILEENKRLSYEIDRFESPIHLMELSRKPEFGHLKYPYEHEIIILPEPENR